VASDATLEATEFLLREVMSQHDEPCVEEGRLVLRHLAGDASALGSLYALVGRTATLPERYWG